MKNIKLVLALLSLVLLAACGGGSGGDTSSGTVISGVASKGIITNGTVTIFALKADGSKGVQLGSGSTNSSGAYSISIGNYAGPVMVEAYGGYTDEATGIAMTVPSTDPLRAVMANATGAVAISVTPLTDLAVRQAGTLTAENITAANALISDLFKVDIVTTAPAAPTASAFGASATTQAQKDYALALAAVSQLMTTEGTLEETLKALKDGIGQGVMGSDTAAAISDARAEYISSHSDLPIAGTPLPNIGETTMTLTVVLEGAGASSVKGIQATIALPTGVTLRAVADGQLASGVLTQAASAPTGSIDGKYTAATNSSFASVTLGYAPSGVFAAGDVLILTVDLSPGVLAPAATAFSFSGDPKLKDVDGNTQYMAALRLR